MPERPDWVRRFIARRQELGLSQGDIAEQIGTSQASVDDWERGRSYPRSALFPAIDALFGEGFCASLFHGPGGGQPPRDARPVPATGLDSRIANLWNAYLDGGRVIAAKDVMQMFKLAEIAKAGS